MDKIIVNPEKVRGLGNIIISKPISDYKVYKNDLSEVTDVTEGIIAPIFKMEYNSLVVEIGRIELSSNVSQAYVENNIVFSATVVTVDDEPATGQTVTFYQGETVLGTGVTNSNGVASLTHAWLGDGEFSISCVCGGVSSNIATVTIIPKLVPVISISTSDWILYRQGTTLPVTVGLTDNGEAFANQSVTLYSNNSVVTTASTDSDGEISTNITVNARANLLLRAVYEGNSSHEGVETTSTTYVGANVYLNNIEEAE